MSSSVCPRGGTRKLPLVAPVVGGTKGMRVGRVVEVHPPGELAPGSDPSSASVPVPA